MPGVIYDDPVVIYDSLTIPYDDGTVDPTPIPEPVIRRRVGGGSGVVSSGRKKEEEKPEIEIRIMSSLKKINSSIDQKEAIEALPKVRKKYKREMFQNFAKVHVKDTLRVKYGVESNLVETKHIKPNVSVKSSVKNTYLEKEEDTDNDFIDILDLLDE